MQIGRLLQTVAIMLLVAAAASCAAGKDYSSRIFPSRNAPLKQDTVATALHFLDLDTAESDKANWVSTDLIMGRDSSNGTATLDNFSKTFPSSRKDTTKAQTKKEPVKNTGPVILTEANNTVKKDSFLARSYDMGPVRNKKSREQP